MESIYQHNTHGLLTSDEARAYLVSYGIPVKSRGTFYKYVDNHEIHYEDLTPWSKKITRRFAQEDLDKFLVKVGLRSQQAPENQGYQDTAHDDLLREGLVSQALNWKQTKN